jgi:competence protein ComEC
MNIWNNIPFARFLIAFLAGIIAAINVPILSTFNATLLLVPFFLYYLFYKKYKLNYKLRYFKGIPIILFFILFGMKLVMLHTQILYANHFSKTSQEYFLVKIAEPPKNKANTLKIIGEVVQVKSQNVWTKTTGKLLIYIAKDANAINLNYGDILLCKAKIATTPPPKNPFEFNYKKYLAFHQINHQTYLNSRNWLKTGEQDYNKIMAFSYELRNYLLRIISNSKIAGDEYAIGSALILGYEDDLSNQIISTFAATGALHVLSVSGLHVGIIFLVINFLLKFLGESKTARISALIISLIGLWIYALITGLSPSVWRAAAMFSLISIGKFYKKDVSTFNIVACSAFILLCINPFMITEVGFQLSYLAVIGIVSLHQKFYSLITVKNKVLDNVWSITSVSFAAQLVTFPLGLLYFHQFPNYFLFSNLIVIPLSTLILYGGILLLAVAKIPIAGAFIANLLNLLLWLLKNTVALFEHLPYAIVEGISISTFETFIIYGILILVYCFWLYRKMIYIQLSLALGILFCSFQITEKVAQKRQEKIVIYAINKHFAVDFISGEHNVFIADSVLINDKDKLRFHLLPNWINLGVSHTNSFKVENNIDLSNRFMRSQGNYLFYKNKTILCCVKEMPSLKTLIYKPQIVLLNINNKLKFNAFFKLFPKATYICDGTISPLFYQKLKNKNPNIIMKSVLQEGAIIIEA